MTCVWYEPEPCDSAVVREKTRDKMISTSDNRRYQMQMSQMKRRKCQGHKNYHIPGVRAVKPLHVKRNIDCRWYGKEKCAGATPLFESLLYHEGRWSV